MRTRQIGLYAQEQWTLDRLTLYGGLRFDYDRGWNPAQDVPAGPYIGARHYDKVDNVPNWKDINPRMGVAFDLFGNGRTAVKANLGRFVAFEANSGINFSSNPANAIVDQCDARLDRRQRRLRAPGKRAGTAVERELRADRIQTTQVLRRGDCTAGATAATTGRGRCRSSTSW